jgi:hypothetical protein
MPDYAGFLRIGKLVSVLVSVADHSAPKPLLHTQLELEAEVGIEPSAVTRQFAKVIPEKRDPVHSDVSFDWKPFAISRLKVTCLSPGICVCSSPRGKTVLLLSDQERIGSSFGRSQVLGGIKIKAQWCK